MVDTVIPLSTPVGNGEMLVSNALRGAFGLGVQVDRATEHMGDKDIFSVDGGRVLLTGILGIVTTAIGGGSEDIELDFDPDNSESTIALCTVTLIDGDPVGTMYTLAAAVGSALTIGTQTIAIGPVPGWVLEAGDIVLDETGTELGSIQWTVWYIPLDEGATVTAV
jgi:hypothetical protein